MGKGKKSHYGKKKSKVITKKNFTPTLKKALLKTEQEHFHDYYLSGVTSTTANIQDINAYAQGTTDVTRIGDESYLKSVRIQYTILPGAASSTSSTVRVMIIQWMDNTNPAIADILQNSGIGTAIVSPYTEDFNRRNNTLKIVYDKCHIISGLSGGPAGAVVQNKFLKGFKRYQHFSNAGTDVLDGSLFVVVLTDQGTNPPNWNFNSRIKFINK